MNINVCNIDLVLRIVHQPKISEHSMYFDAKAMNVSLHTYMFAADRPHFVWKCTGIACNHTHTKTFGFQSC